MAADSTERRNYRILLGQGIFGTAGYNLTSVRMVLPFIYTAVGAPIAFAGMLVPIFNALKLVSEIVAAPFISAAQSNRWFIMATTLVAAIGIFVICVTIEHAPIIWMVVLFFVVAAALGAADGLAALAYKDMISRVLSSDGRGRLLFLQSGIAGLIAIAVAILSRYLFDANSSIAEHHQLIWAGIALLAVSGFVILIVREPPKASAIEKRKVEAQGRIKELRDSLEVAFKLRWFQRFLIARVLFLSVELAVPFFAIHAATLHGANVKGLSTFVVASSLGLVAGGFVWPRIGRSSIRLMLAAAASVTCLGGFLALVIDADPTLQALWLHGLVFALVGFGAQGITEGRTVYLVSVAAEDVRPYCIAAANLVTGAIAIGLGFAVAALAHLHNVTLPIIAMIVLNIAAVLYTARLITAEQEKSAPNPDELASAKMADRVPGSGF